MQEQIIFKRPAIVNVQCVRCGYWQWVGYCEKKEEGWVCDECEEEETNEI